MRQRRASLRDPPGLAQRQLPAKLLVFHALGQELVELARATDRFATGGLERRLRPMKQPAEQGSRRIEREDLLLIDMWAKLDQPRSVYYDITWTGYCGTSVPPAMLRVFDVVKEARDRAVRRVQSAMQKGEPLRGFEVDDAAREHIKAQGFGDSFVHRTGHSIGEEVHGAGANMDNLETHDERRIIPWTCFSVEPGIYLADFGIRSEVNVFVGEKEAHVTGEVQQELVLV